MELKEQKEELQATLKDLKSAQAQLVQSEKMASLGELTAGIAHEIQNPLNFVNNFCEVNTEMIGEAEKEINNGNYHGITAKDKSFNATVQTDFDDSIGKINVVPQDIGKVLLNLFNNAFYALSQRRKAEGVGFEPTVFVSTKKVNDE